MRAIFLMLLTVGSPWLKQDDPTRPRQTDAAKQALDAQQGTWLVVSSRRDGREAPEELLSSIRRVVERDHAYWTRDDKRFAGTTIVLDPNSDPKAIDVIPDGGPQRDQHVFGIYRLEGDQLTICMADAGEPRPDRFSAEAKERHTLMVFRRARANEGKAARRTAKEDGR